MIHNTKNYHIQSEAGLDKAKRIVDETGDRMFEPR